MALRLGVDGEEVSKSPTSCFWMILFFFVRFFTFILISILFCEINLDQLTPTPCPSLTSLVHHPPSTCPYLPTITLF